IHYLRLAFVPYPLVLDYGWPAARSLADVAAPATILIALVALTVWAVVRRHPIAFAGVWFFGILAPTSSVIPIATEVAAEYRMYLPLAAILSVVVLGAFSAAQHASAARFGRVQKHTPRVPSSRPRPFSSGAAKRVGASATVAVLAVFALLTDRRN